MLAQRTFLVLVFAAAAAVAQDFVLPAEQAFDFGDERRPGAARPGGDPRIEECRVDLVDDVNLPSLDAGILLHLAVKEGDLVRSEDIIARIDDREPKQEKRRAKYALNRAVQQAKNRISVDFAEAQHDVAVANRDELEDTNRRLEKAVPEADVRQARLEVRSSELRIKNAEHELDLAELDAWTAKVEVEMADMLIDRRVIRAPFDGEVIEVFRQQQEWVSPGDAIVRLVRLDTLKVEGVVNADQYSAAELLGCEVTVDVPVSAGRVVQATGRVVFADPILMRGVDGQLRKIRAEIANRREGGHWLIEAKRQAAMTVHLGTGGVSAASR